MAVRSPIQEGVAEATGTTGAARAAGAAWVARASGTAGAATGATRAAGAGGPAKAAQSTGTTGTAGAINTGGTAGTGAVWTTGNTSGAPRYPAQMEGLRAPRRSQLPVTWLLHAARLSNQTKQKSGGWRENPLRRGKSSPGARGGPEKRSS
ncbi:Golgi-associated RAB2B interactor protein 3-like [Macrobrachium rosenbergii]|uniref:Golgi-associated RAB2B interactor protein 3-like n=1 Tax=Macrobrachium rosenbergii TaxID=79674 RepID=UPI0034D5D9DF